MYHQRETLDELTSIVSGERSILNYNHYQYAAFHGLQLGVMQTQLKFHNILSHILVNRMKDYIGRKKGRQCLPVLVWFEENFFFFLYAST